MKASMPKVDADVRCDAALYCTDLLRRRQKCSAKKHGTLRLRLIVAAACYFLAGLVALTARADAQAVLPTTSYSVGMTQAEFFDPADRDRPLDYMLIYPAIPDRAATPFR